MPKSKFTLNEIAHAAGITYTQLNNWISRDMLYGLNNQALRDLSQGRGVKRELSLQVAAMIILAAAMNRLKAPIYDASKVAFDWAFIGSFDDGSESGWVGDPATQAKPATGLKEFSLYRDGFTVLAFAPDGDRLHARILNIKEDTPAIDIWAEMLPGTPVRSLSGFKVISLNWLMKEAFETLGASIEELFRK